MDTFSLISHLRLCAYLSCTARHVTHTISLSTSSQHKTWVAFLQSVKPLRRSCIAEAHTHSKSKNFPNRQELHDKHTNRQATFLNSLLGNSFQGAIHYTYQTVLTFRLFMHPKNGPRHNHVILTTLSLSKQAALSICFADNTERMTPRTMARWLDASTWYNT